MLDVYLRKKILGGPFRRSVDVMIGCSSEFIRLVSVSSEQREFYEMPRIP